MRDILGPGTTLAYCTNALPGATTDRILAGIRDLAEHARPITGAEHPLAIGLWAPAASMPPPPDRRAAPEPANAGWWDGLAAQGVRVASLNAFPYDDFHTPVVKHRVYQPDWSTASRADYTAAAARLLARIGPRDTPLSISTLPLGWASGSDEALRACAGARLRDLAERVLAPLSDRLAGASDTARLTVDLEPEPGCILDTSEDVIAFFDEHLPDQIHRRHIGVCHDVCHAAVMFEEQHDALSRYADAGVRVNKMQLSAAIEADVRTLGAAIAGDLLRRFAEPRYLHQTGLMGSGGFELIEDLPDALHRLESPHTADHPDRLRVHFHVPICLEAIGGLRTTADQIPAAVAAARILHDCRIFEIETYAWSVLPDGLRPGSVAEGIARELRWVSERTSEWVRHPSDAGAPEQRP